MMPWEWKEEPQKVPAQLFVNRRPYPWVKNMMALTGLAIFFSVIITIGFGLLVGYAIAGIYQSEDNQFYYYSATTFKAGFTVGIALVSIAAFASFIIGIVMLTRSYLFLSVSEHGLILAMAVVTLLGASIFVSIILGIILLIRLVAYKDLPLRKNVSPKQPSSPAPLTPPPAVPSI